MPERQFYVGLLLTLAITVGAQAILSTLIPSIEGWNFYIIVASIFVALTIIMYMVGKKASNNSDPLLFGKAFLVFTFTKIVLSIFIILICEKMGISEDRLYLLTLLMIYVCFTVFETIIFMKLSKSASD